MGTIAPSGISRSVSFFCARTRCFCRVVSPSIGSRERHQSTRLLASATTISGPWLMSRPLARLLCRQAQRTLDAASNASVAQGQTSVAQRLALPG